MAALRTSAPLAWHQVLLLAWLRVRRGSGLGALGALLLATLLLPSVLRAAGAARAAQELTPVLLGTLLLVLWCLFVSGLLRQNQPAAARLVPGHLRTLRLVLLAAWLAAVLLQGVLATSLFGLGLAWNLCAAVLLVAAALVLRVPSLLFLTWVLPAFAWWWTQLRVVQWAYAVLLQFVADSPATAVLATLACASLCLPAVLQGGGTAHQRNQARREAWRRRPGAVVDGDRRQPGSSALPLPGWLRQHFRALYRAWLAHLSRRPGSPAMARAMLALGPSAHWTQQVTVLAILAAVTVAILAALLASGALPIAGFQRKQLIGAAIGLMSFALSPLGQLATAMPVMRREQALLMLLPGMPRGAALNRALARRLALRHLVAWAAASAAASWLIGPGSGSWQTVQAVVWGTLPFGLLLWRDWSRAGTQTSGQVAAWVAVLVATVLALAGLLQWTGIASVWLAAASVTVTLVLGVWRWRRLAQAPSAWPTGHAVRGGARGVAGQR